VRVLRHGHACRPNPPTVYRRATCAPPMRRSTCSPIAGPCLPPARATRPGARRRRQPGRPRHGAPLAVSVVSCAVACAATLRERRSDAVRAAARARDANAHTPSPTHSARALATHRPRRTPRARGRAAGTARLRAARRSRRSRRPSAATRRTRPALSMSGPCRRNTQASRAAWALHPTLQRAALQRCVVFGPALGLRSTGACSRQMAARAGTDTRDKRMDNLGLGLRIQIVADSRLLGAGASAPAGRLAVAERRLG
jgi:hypothetical protein